MWLAGLSTLRVARKRFDPFVDTSWSFTPPGIQKAKLLAFRPLVVAEIAAIYSALPSVQAFDHGSRLGLSVSAFRLVECLNIPADCVTYFALC